MVRESSDPQSSEVGRLFAALGRLFASLGRLFASLYESPVLDAAGRYGVRIGYQRLGKDLTLPVARYQAL